jgi:hypothetical protein
MRGDEREDGDHRFLEGLNDHNRRQHRTETAGIGQAWDERGNCSVEYEPAARQRYIG